MPFLNRFVLALTDPLGELNHAVNSGSRGKYLSRCSDDRDIIVQF